MVAPALAGLRVLVTRPAHQADGFCQLLEAAGAVTRRLPVIAIATIKSSVTARRQLSELSSCDLAIFISANAVEYSHALRPMPWPELPTQRIAAIGRATAAALAARAMPAGILPDSGFDSEALLALPELANTRTKSVNIFRGEGGRDCLRDKLTARGARVNYVETYRRTRPQVDAETLASVFAPNTLDVLTASSDAGLDNLVSLATGPYRAALLALPLVVNSQRNFRRARALGFNSTVLVPSSPGDQGQLAALINWHSKRHRQQ